MRRGGLLAVTTDQVLDLFASLGVVLRLFALMRPMLAGDHWPGTVANGADVMPGHRVVLWPSASFKWKGLLWRTGMPCGMSIRTGFSHPERVRPLVVSKLALFCACTAFSFSCHAHIRSPCPSIMTVLHAPLFLFILSFCARRVHRPHRSIRFPCLNE